MKLFEIELKKNGNKLYVSADRIKQTFFKGRLVEVNFKNIKIPFNIYPSQIKYITSL